MNFQASESRRELKYCRQGLADENCEVTEDFSVTKEIQSIINKPEWKEGGRLRLIIEKEEPKCFRCLSKNEMKIISDLLAIAGYKLVGFKLKPL